MGSTAEVSQLRRPPRDRLLAGEAGRMRDAELVAVALRTGDGRRDAVGLAGEMLKQCGGVEGLLSQNAAQLLEVRGLGQAKVAALMAMRELCSRGDARCCATASSARQRQRRQDIVQGCQSHARLSGDAAA